MGHTILKIFYRRQILKINQLYIPETHVNGCECRRNFFMEFRILVSCRYFLLQEDFIDDTKNIGRDSSINYFMPSYTRMASSIFSNKKKNLSDISSWISSIISPEIPSGITQGIPTMFFFLVQVLFFQVFLNDNKEQFRFWVTLTMFFWTLVLVIFLRFHHLLTWSFSIVSR